MSSTIHAIATRAIAISATAVLALASAAAATPASVTELDELNHRAWAGETELLAEVYAPDAVHSATYYDRTREYTGPLGIATVAGSGDVPNLRPLIEIPPAADGVWRWATFHGLGGGTACLFRAVDGQITRHDCALSENSYGNLPSVGLADAEASAAIDEITERLSGSWGFRTSAERLGEVYAADAVHSARYLDRTRRYTGPDEILKVARLGSSPERVGERVDFETPEGELAWAAASRLAGGAVCLFRAVDGMITRHDCVLPIKG